MYRGRYPLGEEVPLVVLTRNATGTPTDPASAPVAAILDGAGVTVRSVLLPPMDRPAVVGLFGGPLFLGADFEVGRYRVVYHFTAGGTAGLEEDDFEVVGGGHPDGAAISMFGYVRPHATYLVHQLDSGKIVRGKNPRI